MATVAATRGKTMSSVRARLGALALAISGILFVFYPLIRPFSDESSLQGAQAFASPAWIVAHMLAIVGFILIALGLLGLYSVLRQSPVECLLSVAIILTWVGVGFTLPYYGAEVFALHAIGQEAVQQHNVALLTLVDAIRYGPAIYVFAVGLLLIAIGPILVAIVVWRSGIMARWSGIPFALAFSLYIPQFFGNQPIRVAHGFLVTLGCILLAWSMVKTQNMSLQPDV